MAVTVTLPPLAAPVDQLWHLLLDLAEVPVAWTLIGGQMVLLHALEHGQVPPQVSQDGDIIADVRADQSALRTVVAALEQHGFDVQTITTDGRAHRYIRRSSTGTVVVDVLAPEGLSERTDLTTTPPGRTIQVPAGQQALHRTERVTVLHEGRSGQIPRPTLLGAIVGKAAACTLPGDSSRHARDLALLCALVNDPFDLREQLTNKDRTRLRGVRQLNDPAAISWQLVPADLRGRGLDAFTVLRASP
jgi:hypothetical protein